MIDLTKEESYVISEALMWGWERIYCYFNNKEPYNCVGKNITMPAGADFNGMIWICDDCRQKLIDKLRENKK